MIQHIMGNFFFLWSLRILHFFLGFVNFTDTLSEQGFLQGPVFSGVWGRLSSVPTHVALHPSVGMHRQFWQRVGGAASFVGTCSGCAAYDLCIYLCPK